MDNISLNEIRLIARALTKASEEEQESLMRGLEFLLQQEEAAQRDIDHSLLEPCSVTASATLMAGESYSFIPVNNHETAIIVEALFINETPTYSKCNLSSSGAILLYLAMGNHTVDSPLLLRGMIWRPGVSLAIKLQNVNPRMLPFSVTITGSRILLL